MRRDFGDLQVVDFMSLRTSRHFLSLSHDNQFSGLILFFYIFYCPDCFSRTCLQVFCWPFICFTALKLVDVAPVGPC